MLAEQRLTQIKTLVEQKGSVTVQELVDRLHTSESTIRRDIHFLDSRGEVVKVHGGAVRADASFRMRDDEMSQRRQLHMEEKRRIARYAAMLVEKNDFVYLDAGTTTEFIIDFLTEKDAVYVTNAAGHAAKLADHGFEVYLIGGRVKLQTGASIGSQALEALSGYHFTLGFWGANGVHRAAGFTTPDREEAGVKRLSFQHCKRRFVVADSSKLDVISPVSFAPFDAAILLTDRAAGYDGLENIIVADREREGKK